MMADAGGFDGEAQSDGDHAAVPHERGLGGDTQEDSVLFDVEEFNVDWSEWLPGVDYLRAIRAAKRGERAVWRLLRGVRRRGSRIRTVALCTRDGEPVTRVDMHPDGWRELAAHIRDLEQRAAR